MSQPYRADHVGSLLRPAAVKEARAAYRAGRLPLAELQHIEDCAILAVLDRQRSIGVDIFTDGEFRRSGFQGDLAEAVEGFVATDRPAAARVWQGPGGTPQEQGARQIETCGAGTYPWDHPLQGRGRAARRAAPPRA